MKKLVGVVVLLIAVLAANAVSAAEDEDISLTVAGVRVIAGEYKDGDQKIAAFMGQEGVTVALMVSSKSGGIIEFNN